MRKTKLFLLTLISLTVFTGNIFAQVVGDYGSNATGNWGTDGTNWIVCVADGTWDGATAAASAPTSSTNVWIRSGHIVTVEVTGKTCNNLTVESSATLNTTSAFITGTTGSTLTLQSNAYWKQAGSSAAMPCTTKSLANTSTVEFSGSQSALSVFTYGNLIWSSSSTCGISQGNTLTINGNLTLHATMRGNSSTSGSNVHTIGGNVVVDVSGKYLSGINNTAATTGSATWNIGGDVTLTNGARLQIFESAGPHSGTSTYNINGNLNIGTGSSVSLRSSSTANASSGVGTVNLKGNIVNSGTIATTTGATGGAKLNFNLIGTSSQQWTGSFPGAFPTGQSCSLTINNGSGIVLNSAVTVNTNDALVFSNGVLNIGDNNFRVGTGTISGASSSSYIVAEGVGTIIQTVPASTEVLFPVGSASAYTPVKVNPTTASDFAVKMTTSPISAPGNVIFNAETWDITPVTPSATVLTLTTASPASTITKNIYHWNGVSYDAIPATLTGNDYTATVSTFSPFTTGGATVATALETNNIKNVYFDGKTIHNPDRIYLQVYDVTGKLINESNLDINLTGKVKGIYIIKGQNSVIKVRL